MSLTVGFSVTHRRYVPYAHAHYGGNLVDGAYGLALFGDVATDLSIHTDGDESLLAGYSTVEFLAPIQAGDGRRIPPCPIAWRPQLPPRGDALTPRRKRNPAPERLRRCRHEADGIRFVRVKAGRAVSGG